MYILKSSVLIVCSCEDDKDTVYCVEMQNQKQGASPEEAGITRELLM